MFLKNFKMIKKMILTALLLAFLTPAFAEINIKAYCSPYGSYQTLPGQVYGQFFNNLGATVEYEHNFDFFDVSAGLGVKEADPYLQRLNFSAGIGKKFPVGKEQHYEIDVDFCGNIGIISIPKLTCGLSLTAVFEKANSSGFFGGLGAEVMFTPKYNWHGTKTFWNFPVFAGWKFCFPTQFPAG